MNLRVARKVIFGTRSRWRRWLNVPVETRLAGQSPIRPARVGTYQVAERIVVRWERRYIPF